MENGVDASAPSGRALGIDFGERRIGLALSDPSMRLATPLETLERRAGKRMPLQRILDRIPELGVVQLVVGLPLDLRGEASDWTREVERLGAALSDRSGLPVSFVDERFSSVQAERAIRSSGLPRSERERKDRIDAGAAAVILQGWLDRRRDR